MGLSSATLLFVGTFVTMFGVGVVIAPEPWYAPRYVLPILGMVLGSPLWWATFFVWHLPMVALTNRTHTDYEALIKQVEKHVVLSAED